MNEFVLTVIATACIIGAGWAFLGLKELRQDWKSGAFQRDFDDQ